MFYAWLSLQPPITPARRETVFVHSARTYDGEAVARITKDGQQIAEVPVMALADGSVFSFHFGTNKPPFSVAITRDGKLLDSGTIESIGETQ